MLTFSKTLNIKDYEDMSGYVQHIKNMQGVLSDVPARFEHQHRYWEYALALKVIAEQKSKTVLDVGGGGSIFAPAAAWVGHEVTVVDNGDVGAWIAKQNTRTGHNVEFHQQDFISYNLNKKYDAVVCLSVLEHIPNDIEFFNKLLDGVNQNGVLVLTVDFHPSGVQIVGGHIRAYNKDSISNLLTLAAKRNFVSLGKPSYDYFEANVNGCTFASLVLVKQIVK